LIYEIRKADIKYDLIDFTYLCCTYTDVERTKWYLGTTISHYIHVIDILNFLIHCRASLDISDFFDVGLPHYIYITLHHTFGGESREKRNQKLIYKMQKEGIEIEKAHFTLVQYQ
jgi:hypothetical protein